MRMQCSASTLIHLSNHSLYYVQIKIKRSFFFNYFYNHKQLFSEINRCMRDLKFNNSRKCFYSVTYVYSQSRHISQVIKSLFSLFEFSWETRFNQTAISIIRERMLHVISILINRTFISLARVFSATLYHVNATSSAICL